MTVNPDNYRSSREYREILRILQKASTLHENFVWQSRPSGKTVVPIHHFEIDFVAREVVIFCDQQLDELDPSLVLYVKLDYRTSVFKITDSRVGQGTLHFSFPKEIKTQELRINPRHSFSEDDDKYVSVRPAVQREGVGEIQVRTVDISYFGIGLIISEQNRSFIKNNRILWITKLQDMPLPYPILAEVVYIAGEQGRKQRELKVGLKLSGVFPEDIYQGFIG